MERFPISQPVKPETSYSVALRPTDDWTLSDEALKNIGYMQLN